MHVQMYSMSGVKKKLSEYISKILSLKLNIVSIFKKKKCFHNQIQLLAKYVGSLVKDQ